MQNANGSRSRPGITPMSGSPRGPGIGSARVESNAEVMRGSLHERDALREEQREALFLRALLGRVQLLDLRRDRASDAQGLADLVNARRLFLVVDRVRARRADAVVDEPATRHLPRG